MFGPQIKLITMKKDNKIDQNSLIMENKKKNTLYYVLLDLFITFLIKW